MMGEAQALPASWECSQNYIADTVLCSISSNMEREKALESLRRLEGRPFRVKDAENLGVAAYELRRMRARGDLTKLARGVYQQADAAPSATIDLATVSARVPVGAISLNSALAYWDLTDEIPSAVHVAVPRGAHRPRIDYPPTKVHVFAPDTFKLGRIEQTGEVSGSFWIYSPERTIVDAMRLPHVVGRDQALGALRRYLGQRGSRPAELVQLADMLRAGRPVREALEVLLS
jgi:predicted transcriptional regulator of viral defense system